MLRVVYLICRGPFAAVYQIWESGKISKSVSVEEWILVVGELLLTYSITTQKLRRNSGKLRRLALHRKDSIASSPVGFNYTVASTVVNTMFQF